MEPARKISDEAHAERMQKRCDKYARRKVRHYLIRANLSRHHPDYRQPIGVHEQRRAERGLSKRGAY